MKKIACFTSAILFLLIVYCSPCQCATLKLNKSKITIQYGKTYQLKANQKVTWSSNNTKIATISSSGKVKAISNGITTITAKNKKGKKKTCKVIVQNYVIKKTNNKEYPNKITVYTNGKPKTYTVYNQKGYSNSWVKTRGCSASVVAMVSSAYGQMQSPMNIHYGTPNRAYSERYALGKLGKKVKINNKSLTIYSLAQMLNNTGIRCHAVYKYNNTNAIKDITENLKKGKPVIIICHNKKVKGNRLATNIHFLVLAGIDTNGKTIVLDPNGGGVNKSPHTGSFSLTVSQIVKRHMWSCTGNDYKQFYYKKTRNAGGYIIIDE